MNTISPKAVIARVKELLETMIELIDFDEDKFTDYTDWEEEIQEMEWYFDDTKIFTEEHQALFEKFTMATYITKGDMTDVLPEIKALYDAL